MNWQEVYNKAKAKLDLGKDEYNKDMVFETSTLRTPAFIVKEWVKQTLAEPPTIFYKKDEDTSEEIELPFKFREFETKLLSLGKVLIIPMQHELLVIDEYKHKLEYAIQGNQLIFAEFQTNEKKFINKELKDVKYIHTYSYENGVCLYTLKEDEKVVVIDNVPQENINLGSYMIPMMIFNDVEGHTGVPVYYLAHEILSDIDDVYAEMKWDIKCSRKLVLVPDIIKNSKIPARTIEHDNNTVVKKTNQQANTLPNVARKITLDGETVKPTIVDSEMYIESYVKAMNFMLHIVSMFSGFGPDYLCYDIKSGGLKTATEVASDRTEMQAGKKNIQENLEKAIRHCLIVLSEEKGLNVEDESKFEIVFYDNIPNDDVARFDRLYKDRLVDNINLEYYLQEVYSMDEKDIEAYRGTGGIAIE